MRRFLVKLSPFPFLILFLSGCDLIGEKTASMSMSYCVTAVLSLLLLICYFVTAKKREIWYLLLFSSVFIVNIGYFMLAISRNLEEALLANRLAYLGSVFLPLSMWMIILNTTHFRYAKWLPGLLVGLAVIVFFIAASPGYLPIYYQDVTFEKINGVSTLVKVYGPLHVIYLLYLLGYFSTMVATIVHATLKNKIDSPVHATILALAVFVNIGVWMIEQMVRIDFEILSISYIISESFLLGLNLLIAETEQQTLQLSQQNEISEPVPPTPEPEQIDRERAEQFRAGLSNLTPKERQIYACYVSGMTTDVIMEQLCIKENTLKFHNKNLYSKMGVRSRKQLMELHKQCACGNDVPFDQTELPFRQ